MDEIRAGQINYRNFALPLYLLSVVFFMLYILVVLWVLIMTLHRPWDFGTVSQVIGGLVLLVSGIGTILFVREMRAQSLPWTAGLPLLTLFGAISIFAVIYQLPFFRYYPAQVYPGIFALAGFMSLPYGVAYLLRNFQGIELRALQSYSARTGIFGFVIALIVFFSLFLGSSLPGSGILFPWAALFGVFHIAVLMPLAGVKLFRLGTRLSKNPPPEVEAGTAAEPAPRKKIVEILREILRSTSPRVKWAILLVALLILVIAGYYVYQDITDTTPGKRWTQVTTSAPFGSNGGFSSAEYHGKLWIIGGAGTPGPDGYVWYTSDGEIWIPASSADTVPQRMGASSAVFSDALWVIGGTDLETLTPSNSIWYSGNGINWSEIQPKSVFSPRAWHSSVVFQDRIWVIGGNRGTTTEDLAGDIWYSGDGISWQQATPAAEFSPRADHSSFVYRDKIWVMGGRDNTGYISDVWNSGDGIHWTQVTASVPFAGDAIFHAVVFDGRIWVIRVSQAQNKNEPWITERSGEIWYSYDGITWTNVRSSPEFFNEEYNVGQPIPMVFDNRLFVLQRYNRGAGIWYTMPEGSVS